ncbi:Cytochrome P450 [Penicillium expansum]|nr:Cytochrome P450 [Penicillium expansum]KGO69146.1 Cytochrome P450 [Penicillium expansum]
MKLAPAFPRSYFMGRFWAGNTTGDGLEQTWLDGYYRYTKRGKVFARKTELNNWSLIFPSELSHDWRNLPLDQISFQHWAQEGGKIKHHTVLTKVHSKVALLFAKKELLLAVQKILVKETLSLLPGIIGDKWVSLDLMQVCSDLVIKLNARILYGPAYADDQDFHKRLITFANGVDGINSIYFTWPRSLWKIVSLVHPTIRGFYANLPHLKKRMLPDIRSRIAKLQAKAAQGEGKVPASDEDVTFMTALIKMHMEEGTLGEQDSDLEKVCMEAVFYTYEFWGPIMPTLFFMLMAIGKNPGYLQALREEISSALESNDWSSDFLARTPKLESFIREVLRLYVPAQWLITDIHRASLATVSRRTEKPIYVQSMDMHIPAGVNLCVPAKYIHRDPDFYPNPTTFDGFRFYDPVTNNVTIRATTATDTYLSFSHGSGLCPGRVFGAHVVQVLCAVFIMEYDVKVDPSKTFPDVQSTKEGRGDGMVGTTDILIRKRTSAKV